MSGLWLSSISDWQCGHRKPAAGGDPATIRYAAVGPIAARPGGDKRLKRPLDISGNKVARRLPLA